MAKSRVRQFEEFFEQVIFWGRWIQAPMYLGLIFGSFMYLYKFFEELYHIFHGLTIYTEAQLMLGVLGLVDISMVMNLIVMVIVGGYSIFTSKIDVAHHEDKPQWLDGLDAGKLKIKLASSLASISGVHLLKTFIDVRGTKDVEGYDGIMVEIAIHLTFIISALLLAWTEKIQHSYGQHATHEESVR